jgi:hypothetical protein
MSSQQRQQEEALEHEEVMALHQANTQQARHGPNPADQARLLDKVVESELDTDDDGLSNLRAKDFPLGNYDEEADAHEFKWIQEILNIFSKARHPHARSGLQGLSRAWAAGDSGNRLGALALDELAQDEAYLLGTYSRAKRGEDMAQQETSAKQVNETHAIREDSGGSSSGGLLGRFRG